MMADAVPGKTRLSVQDQDFQTVLATLDQGLLALIQAATVYRGHVQDSLRQLRLGAAPGRERASLAARDPALREIKRVARRL